MNLKGQYWKYSIVILIFFMSIMFFCEPFNFMSIFLGAGTIYILVHKQIPYLINKRGLKKNMATSLILGEAIIYFLIPICLTIWLLSDQLKGISLDPLTYLATIHHLGELIQQNTGYNILSKENINTITPYLPKVGEILIGSISSFAINLAVLLIVLYFMLRNGQQLEQYLYTLLPFNDNNKNNVLRKINVKVRLNANI